MGELYCQTLLLTKPCVLLMTHFCQQNGGGASSIIKSLLSQGRSPGHWLPTFIMANSAVPCPTSPGPKGYLPGKPPHRLQSAPGTLRLYTSLGRVGPGRLGVLLCGAQVNAKSLFAHGVPVWCPCASPGHGQGRDGAEVPAADHGVPGTTASLCLAAGTSRRDPGCRTRS